MPRRFLPTLAAPLALTLLLFGCGDQSSDTAEQPMPEDDAAYEQAALPEDDAESGGYEEIDQSAGAEQQAAADPGYAPRQPVPQQTATQAVGAGVQGDVEMFYDALGRDGAWVEHPDYSYVWLPSRMGPGWRPYQEGRWIWTDDYGWYWESEEPFAWAVYHYGRWDYDPDYGWFWVPGDTWAPAWVTWRVGGDSVGWAPIAPDHPGFASGMPRRYAPPVAESWVFVDAPNFGAPDLAPHVRPINRIGPSLEVAREVRTPRFERNRVVNFGAPPDELRRYLRGPIETRRIYYVGNRNDMFDDVRGRRVGIYRPIIARSERRGPPPRLADVGQTNRVVIVQFAGPGLFDAPSVALLDVLDPRERQSLAEARLSKKQAAVDARIAELQRERAALIEGRRKQAKKVEAKVEKERQEAKAERKKLRELVRAEKQKRAAKIKLQAPLPAEDTATQAPAPAEPPVESAVAPAEPVPSAPGAAAAPPPPAETGAVEEPKDEEPPAPEMGAAEPAPAPQPAAEPQPAPAPEPTAEPAPEPAPAQQEAKETPPATPAPEPQPVQEAPAPPPAAQDVQQDVPRKKKRPVETARPEPAQPTELPPPAEAVPPPAPPEAMQPPPQEAPGPAAEAPSDPTTPIEKAKKRKAQAAPPAEAPPALGEPPAPAEMPSEEAPPPPAE